MSSSVMATKLNPRNSWWALALGGTPGESEERHREEVSKSSGSAFAAPCDEGSLTSWRLGRKLRIKVEGVIGPARRWLERGVDLPAEQFLQQETGSVREREKGSGSGS